MLFAGWEVRIVKNCDRGLENAARGRRPRAAFSRPRSQFFTIRTDPKPVNNLFIFIAYKKLFQFLQTQGQNLTKALPWPVGRYRRILPALTTNQNAGFVTVPSENKIKFNTFHFGHVLLYVLFNGTRVYYFFIFMTYCKVLYR